MIPAGLREMRGPRRAGRGGVRQPLPPVQRPDPREAARRKSKAKGESMPRRKTTTYMSPGEQIGAMEFG